MKPIERLEQEHLKERADFNVGDVVRVSIRVVEGDKTRLQNFEGTVIRKKGKGTAATFTVLKQTKGSQDTVEKTFPLYSPNVDKIKVIKSKKVRRSRLYYMRSKK